MNEHPSASDPEPSGPSPALELLAEQIPLALWVVDRTLHITHALGRLTERAGGKALVGKTLPELLGTTPNAGAAMANHMAALNGEPSSFDYELFGMTWNIHVQPLQTGTAVTGAVAVAIDVTERRKAELLLRVSERRFLDAQRLAHVGSWEWLVSTNRVEWSEELFAIYGITRESFDGTYEAFLDRVHPEDRDRTRESILRALAEKGPFDYYHRVQRPDGSVRMLHTRGSAVTNANGVVLGLVGSCWDVTERWATTHELEQNVALLRSILDSTGDGLLVVDKEGAVTTYNQAFLSLWRIPAGVAGERRDRVLLDAVRTQLEDPDTFMRDVASYYARPDAEGEDVVRLRGGRVLERYTRPHRVLGATVGRVWSFHDVTERERLLAEKEKLLDRALFLSDCSRLLATLEIDAALDAVAHRSVGLLGETCICDLFEAEGGPRRVAVVSSARGLQTQVPPLMTRRLPHAEVTQLSGRQSLRVPIMSRGGVIGEYQFVSALDAAFTQPEITLAQELAARTALTLESARLYREARTALAIRQEFVSIIAHELRGPLSALHLAVQALQRHAVPVDAMDRMLDVIEREDRRITRFVDELLELGRIQRAHFAFTIEQINFSELTSDVIARVAPDLAKSGSAISMKVDPNVTGMWDRLKLDQVLTNLISNAIKYGEGRPIEVTLRQRGDRALLTVRDAGIGIDPAQQKGIFEPFERAVSARRYGGIGLGLFIVRTIVEQLGGTVRVESELGHGATFTVDLPISANAQGPSPSSAQAH